MKGEAAVQAANPTMATYHQYSEIVAAYGNRMPPPQQQTPRLTLAFVYAAIGLVLGTFTGTAAAVISMQPGMDTVASHLSFASLRGAGFRIHSIANAGQPPVIQNHSSVRTMPAAQPAALQNQAAVPSTAAAPATTAPEHASTSSQVAHLAKPSAILSPVQSLNARTDQTAAVPAAKPVVKLAAAPPEKAASSPTLSAASVDQAKAVTPRLVKPAVAAKLALPVAAQTQPLDAAPATVPAPVAAVSLGLDGGLKAQLFYSEGDATVASYNAAGDTIETDDGRTFVVGTTVSMSDATSWDDYRANVHYRCDQNGHCTLTRAGVIALNARLI
jgi:hypothetical protein